MKNYLINNRQETLSQLRAKWRDILDFGAEFFVSFNQDFIDSKPIANNEFTSLVTNNLEKTLSSEIGQVEDLSIKFVKFSDTRIMTPNAPQEGLLIVL